MKLISDNSTNSPANITTKELIKVLTFCIDARFSCQMLNCISFGSEDLDLQAVQFLVSSVNYLDVTDGSREELTTLYINQVIPVTCRLLLSYTTMNIKVQLVSGMAFTKLAQLYPNIFKALIGSETMNQTINNIPLKSVLQQTMVLAMQQASNATQSSTTTATASAPMKKLDMSKYKK